MPRRRSGLACASCSSSQPDRSILGLAAIVVLLTRVPWRVLVEDHAVAVSVHDATLIKRADRTPRLRTQLPTAPCPISTGPEPSARSFQRRWGTSIRPPF